MFRKLTGKAPRRALPKGATDCHIHLFDSRNYTDPPSGPPAPADALVEHYEQVQRWLGLDRVVITQGNAYQKDNRCLLAGLDHFGDAARGIVAIDAGVSDQEIEDMTRRGVRGARIMNILGGPVGLDQMLAVNDRVHPFGWSLIVQFDGCDILDHFDDLTKIKGDYVIDHAGKFLDPVAKDSPQFLAILKLLDRGNCYAKIAGCYETSKTGFPSYEDVGTLSAALIQHAPDRAIWASNFPHNMARSAKEYPDDVHLLDLSMEWAGSEENVQLMMVDNPARLYGF